MVSLLVKYESSKYLSVVTPKDLWGWRATPVDKKDALLRCILDACGFGGP
jgi:hypothetical protein